MIVQKELFGEGKHVEFKAEIPKKHEKFLKDIIAFANTSGGKTIVGVEDETGEVIGLGEQNPFKLSDAISNMISDSCTPQIYTDITAKTIDEHTILEVEVFPGVNRPYYLKSVGKEGSAYIRINGTSRPAGEFRLKELEMEGMHVSYDTLWEIGQRFDETATNHLMDEMYHTALSNSKTQEEKAAVHELTIEKLEDFGILRKEEGDYVPTRAFTLLTEPRERYEKIQCALFKGTDRVDFIDRKEFFGPIQKQIEEAHQFVLRHTNKGAVIDGLYRQDVYELPVSAIREIITNAVLHRSYVDQASIQVSIFDDRIEIDSPGMLCAGLSVTDALNGKSKCRNKAIAEAFQYMKIIEGWGTGLPRLFRRCKDGNSGGNGGNSGGNGGNNCGNGHESEAYYGNKISLLSNNEKVILRAIIRDERSTLSQISEEAGIPIRTVERTVSHLKQKQVLEREGSNRSGRWKVVKRVDLD